MNIIIKELTSVEDVRRACEMTMHGQVSRISLRNIYKCEHSPARVREFWIELQGIPTFVSVHLVRHKHGVEHFVQSMRDDLYIGEDVVVTRETPVNHGMKINAQALINMSRKRLCYKAHVKTVAVWRKLLKEVAKVDPDLAHWMVPECVHRGSWCPELRECKPSLERVVKAYEGKGR